MIPTWRISFQNPRCKPEKNVLIEYKVNKSLLDTDTLSEIHKARNAGIIDTSKTYLASYNHFSFSALTVMEVVSGYHRAKRINQLVLFISSLKFHEVIPFTQSIAELAGKIDGDLLSYGQPIGRVDPIIAATAIEHSLTLVTGNIHHYSRIQNLGYPLIIENWRIP